MSLVKISDFNTHFRQRARIDDVLIHLQENIDEHHHIETLAEIACYSKSHFQNLFTEILGEAWHEYLSRTRLVLASKRLTGSNTPIKEIGALAGYSTPANFGRAFKKAFNMTPAIYRSMYRGQRSIPLMIVQKLKRRTPIIPTITDFAQRTIVSIDCETKSYLRYGQDLWDSFCTLHQSLDALPAENRSPLIITHTRDSISQNTASTQAAFEWDTSARVPPSTHRISTLDCGHYATFDHNGILPGHTLNIGLFDWLPTSLYDIDLNRPILIQPKSLNIPQFFDRFKNVSGQHSQRLHESMALSPQETSGLKFDIHIPIKINESQQLLPSQLTG